jgi:predicted transcriptional regulator
MPDNFSIRLEDDMVKRIDRLAAAMTEAAAGAKVTRSQALRAALDTGVPALEKRFGIASPKKRGG